METEIVADVTQALTELRANKIHNNRAVLHTTTKGLTLSVEIRKHPDEFEIVRYIVLDSKGHELPVHEERILEQGRVICKQCVQDEDSGKEVCWRVSCAKILKNPN